MTVNAISSSSFSTTAADSNGVASLDSSDFMTLLITELQNQDPIDPMSNEELLGQLSTMRNLAANVELSETLQSITGTQQLSSATGYLGKSITGTGTLGENVTGVVESAFLREGQAFLKVGDQEVPVTGIQSIQQA